MPVAEEYRRQVALLVQTIPLVAMEDCFALKGGTAINLFVRDMPRLSVDIDLTYLPIKDRDESLNEIDAALKRMAQRIRDGIPGAHVHESAPKNETRITKLNVRVNEVQITIEVTPVLRGCVYEPANRTVSARVEDEFGFAEMQVVSMPDLYAGKLVAALDRQHPRDLFDVRDLLANEGISNEMRKAFIVYLLSHNRSFGEVLAPSLRDISAEFERGFSGMSDRSVTIEELVQTREHLIANIVGHMPPEHRRFLLSVKTGKPDWRLLDVTGAENLPAVRWRLGNLEKLDQKKRQELLHRLREILNIDE